MYGLWVVVGSVLGYYWLVDFGISTAVERGISRAVGKKDNYEINIVVNTGLFLYSLGGLTILLISAIVAYAMPYFINNISDVIIFRQVFIILGLSFAFNFPMRVFSGILRSFLRFDMVNIANFGLVILRASLIYCFLKMGYGIIALAWITLGTDVVFRVTLYILVRKIYPQLRFSKSLIQISKIKGLIKYSSFVFMNQVSQQMRFNIDNLVIVAFMGLSHVTLYSIASRLIRYFMNFMSNALGMMMPLFSRYEGSGNYDAIREKFVFITKVNGYLSILVASVLVIFGRFFIERWMGEDYIYAYNILVVLIIGILGGQMQRSVFEVLHGISKHQVSAVVNLGEAFSNVILSILLVKRFGLMGVAFGTTIPLLIKLFLFLPQHICSVLNISLRKYYMECLIGVVARCALFVGIPYLCYQSFIRPNYLNIFLLACLQSCIFMILVYILGFKHSENQMIRGVLKGTKIAKFIPKALLA